MWRSGSGDNPIPDLRESLNDDLVVTRRVELQETVEKLLKIILGVNFSLQDHLKHWLAEILVWVIGILHHGDAVRDLRARAEHLGAMRGCVVNVERESGRSERVVIASFVPRTWRRVVREMSARVLVMNMGNFGLWLWVENVCWLWLAAAAPIGRENVSEETPLVGRHCRDRERWSGESRDRFCEWV